MNTKIEEIDGKYVATLEGEMDTAAALEAEEVLKPLYTSNGQDVIIDCTRLERQDQWQQGGDAWCQRRHQERV